MIIGFASDHDYEGTYIHEVDTAKLTTREIEFYAKELASGKTYLVLLPAISQRLLGKKLYKKYLEEKAEVDARAAKRKAAAEQAAKKRKFLKEQREKAKKEFELQQK